MFFILSYKIFEGFFLFSNLRAFHNLIKCPWSNVYLAVWKGLSRCRRCLRCSPRQSPHNRRPSKKPFCDCSRRSTTGLMCRHTSNSGADSSDGPTISCNGCMYASANRHSAAFWPNPNRSTQSWRVSPIFTGRMSASESHAQRQSGCSADRSRHPPTSILSLRRQSRTAAAVSNTNCANTLLQRRAARNCTNPPKFIWPAKAK